MGLQIGTQFCPGVMTNSDPVALQLRAPLSIIARDQIEFFLCLKCALRAGSLTSTYRVVRNTTLRAESEIKLLRTKRSRESFSYHKFDPAAAGSTD